MFSTLINRTTVPSEWHKIPWNDLDFSRRMLAEHLSQSHDMASRRQSIIDQHVSWIHRKVLHEQPANILDLGCGPGFYTGRLTALGHTCTGIDFSPASMTYAREHNPGTTYHQGSILDLPFGEGYDLICLIFGELNAFAPDESTLIISKAHAALKPGGALLLEVHPYETAFRSGHQPSSWHTAASGLFSDEPYLCLVESVFDLDRAITNFYVYPVTGSAMQQYTTMLQACTDDEYRQLLAGFSQVSFYPSLSGSAETSDLFVIVAHK